MTEERKRKECCFGSWFKVRFIDSETMEKLSKEQKIKKDAKIMFIGCDNPQSCFSNKDMFLDEPGEGELGDAGTDSGQ